jgi:hypothetical protein
VKKAIRASVLRSKPVPFIGLLALLASGCGYHFAASGSGLPPKAKTIYVATFGNHTRFTGLNDEFMRYMKDEIANHKRLALVDSPDGADLVLSGEVLYNEAIPGATNPVAEPIAYEESLSANATLVDGHNHTIIWISHGLGAAAEVPVVAGSVITTSPYFLQQNLRSQDIAQLPDIQVAQTQNAAGRTQMMQQLAQDIYASMSEGF